VPGPVGIILEIERVDDNLECDDHDDDGNKDAQPDEEAKGTLEGQKGAGTYFLGEGRYKVDHVEVDDSGDKDEFQVFIGGAEEERELRLTYGKRSKKVKGQSKNVKKHDFLEKSHEPSTSGCIMALQRPFFP